MNPIQRAREIFSIEKAAIGAVRTRLDASFTRAVETIVAALQAKRKIVIIGIGKSGNIGRRSPRP